VTTGEGDVGAASATAGGSGAGGTAVTTGEGGGRATSTAAGGSGADRTVVTTGEGDSAGSTVFPELPPRLERVLPAVAVAVPAEAAAVLPAVAMAPAAVLPVVAIVPAAVAVLVVVAMVPAVTGNLPKQPRASAQTIAVRLVRQLPFPAVSPEPRCQVTLPVQPRTEEVLPPLPPRVAQELRQVQLGGGLVQSPQRRDHGQRPSPRPRIPAVHLPGADRNRHRNRRARAPRRQ
jgi:hypothetical protein